MYLYINGEFVKEEEAKVSAFDRGLLYGDGLFETMRIYDGMVFRLSSHMERLRNGLEYLKIVPPENSEELETQIYELVRKNRLKDGYLRLTITRGVGGRGIDIEGVDSPTVIIFSRPVQLPSSILYDNGVELIISSRENTRRADEYDLKSLNFINNILARREAALKGAYEAIMLNKNGYVTEGTVSNIFMIFRGVLSTPSLDSGVLRGITRDTVIEIAREMNLEVREDRLKVEDFFNAEEVFITNSMIEVLPVRKIDNMSFAVGKTTKEILMRYREKVREEIRTAYVRREA